MSKEKRRTLAVENGTFEGLGAISPADLQEQGARLATYFGIRNDVPFTPGELRDLGARFSALSRLLGLDGKSSA